MTVSKLNIFSLVYGPFGFTLLSGVYVYTYLIYLLGSLSLFIIENNLLFVFYILLSTPSLLECPFKPVHVIISSLTLDKIQDSFVNFLGIHIILEVLHLPFVQRMELLNYLNPYNC